MITQEFKDIEVTQSHINRGAQGVTDSCPIALAVMQAFPEATDVYVEGSPIFIYKEEHECSWRKLTAPDFDTEKKINDFIEAFDTGEPVEPFTFKVMVGAWRHMISGFNGEHRFLSNFYPSLIEFEGEWYPTVEHAYQAAKTELRDHRLTIQLASTPSKAKQLGRGLALRSDWEEIKLVVMKRLLVKKFRDPVLAAKLKATDQQILIEGNYWHDNFWGTCVCDKCISGTSKNWLGKLLMEVRQELEND